MSPNRTVVVTSPAKINLGLEILGRREDGYHEIRTILATIGLADILSITMFPARPESRISGVPNVRPEDNLIGRAIAAFANETGIRHGYNVDVTKNIPSPGGLGGASSNAAATLIALNDLHGRPLSRERMHALASILGADVPFFLGPPVALARGTGTELEPLAPLHGGVVLVVPGIEMMAKTAALYGALQKIDFTDGSRIDQGAQAVAQGKTPSPELLVNAFKRPLYDMEPHLADVEKKLLAAGAPHVALTGAGPGHYVIFDSLHEAEEVADRLRHDLNEGNLVTVEPFHASPMSVHSLG